MPVTCPHCGTRYVLPQSLLGPLGARVRCPRCREPFAVDVNGTVVPGDLPIARAPESASETNGHEAGAAVAHAFGKAKEPTGANASTLEAEPVADAAIADTATEVESPVHVPAVSEPAPAHDPAGPEGLARTVLDELLTHSGEAIREARAQGRLFSEFGPVIVEAYEFYRRKVGPGADPAIFRAALRERWGVDLDPAVRPPRP